MHNTQHTVHIIQYVIVSINYYEYPILLLKYDDTWYVIVMSKRNSVLFYYLSMIGTCIL